MAPNPAMAETSRLIDFTVELRSIFSQLDDTASASSRLRTLIDKHVKSLRHAGSKDDPWDLLAHQTAHALLAASTAYPAKVDGLIEIFMPAIADPDSSKGEKQGMREVNEHLGQTIEQWSEAHHAASWARFALRCTKGRQAFFLENLAQTLGMEPLATLQQMSHNDPCVYEDARIRLADMRVIYGPSILLARLFATQPVVRPYLWREVEAALIKAALSTSEKEAGCFLALPILIQGAGHAINHWTVTEGKGVGKHWSSWYGGCLSPFERWSFLDAMTHIVSPGYRTMVRFMEEGLTPDVIKLRKDAEDLAEGWINALQHEGAEPAQLDSAQLDKGYSWAVSNSIGAV